MGTSLLKCQPGLIPYLWKCQILCFALESKEYAAAFLTIVGTIIMTAEKMRICIVVSGSPLVMDGRDEMINKRRTAVRICAHSVFFMVLEREEFI